MRSHHLPSLRIVIFQYAREDTDEKIMSERERTAWRAAVIPDEKRTPFVSGSVAEPPQDISSLTIGGLAGRLILILI